jgi:hypothetical protein
MDAGSSTSLDCSWPTASGLSGHGVATRLAAGAEGEVTLTCVPPGSGVRIGIDRDEDGILDGDERRR